MGRTWHRRDARGSRPPGARAGRLRPCRVEHRHAGAAAVLARGVLAFPHHAELAPFAGRLLAAGAAGQLVLVDEASGADLARRHLRPGPGRHRPSPAAA
jgi:hypothetical protein